MVLPAARWAQLCTGIWSKSGPNGDRDGKSRPDRLGRSQLARNAELCEAPPFRPPLGPVIYRNMVKDRPQRRPREQRGTRRPAGVGRWDQLAPNNSESPRPGTIASGRGLLKRYFPPHHAHCAAPRVAAGSEASAMTLLVVEAAAAPGGKEASVMTVGLD